jgi:hypothetical protein
MEVLRAELASAFVGSELALPTDIPEHARFMATWVKALKEDNPEIFKAAADAHKIADMPFGFPRPISPRRYQRLTPTCPWRLPFVNSSPLSWSTARITKPGLAAIDPRRYHCSMPPMLTDMTTWTGRTGHDRLRSFTDKSGTFWIEQNPTKRSKWAKLAREGHALAWEFGDGGSYTGRMLIDGEIYTPSEATKKFLRAG